MSRHFSIINQAWEANYRNKDSEGVAKDLEQYRPHYDLCVEPRLTPYESAYFNHMIEDPVLDQANYALPKRKKLIVKDYPQLKAEPCMVLPEYEPEPVFRRPKGKNCKVKTRTIVPEDSRIITLADLSYGNLPRTEDGNGYFCHEHKVKDDGKDRKHNYGVSFGQPLLSEPESLCSDRVVAYLYEYDDLSTDASRSKPLVFNEKGELIEVDGKKVEDIDPEAMAALKAKVENAKRIASVTAPARSDQSFAEGEKDSVPPEPKRETKKVEKAPAKTTKSKSTAKKTEDKKETSK